MLGAKENRAKASNYIGKLICFYSVFFKDTLFVFKNPYVNILLSFSIAKSNIIFALGVKGIVLVLGALGYMNMWLAVFADVGVAMIAILNAMRALVFGKRKNM